MGFKEALSRFSPRRIAAERKHRAEERRLGKEYHRQFMNHEYEHVDPETGKTVIGHYAMMKAIEAQASKEGLDAESIKEFYYFHRNPTGAL